MSEDSKAAQSAAKPMNFKVSVSEGFSKVIGENKLSLAISSYQAGAIYLVGLNAQGGINLHQTNTPKPMGLHFDENGLLLLAAGAEIWHMHNVLEPHERANEVFDSCFVPRTINITGNLDAHDIGRLEDGRPIFVNTRFNCLSTTSHKHSFEEYWRPSFISALVDEDRCHLNGLAMDGNTPAYVSAVSRSNTVDGWRDRRSSGGIIISVETGEVVCEGLSMPHSPRLHQGKLWVANAGTGELGWVEGYESGEMGEFRSLTFCPGFLRGLAFHDDLAFIGLSKPRYERFEGLELDARLNAADSEAWCGVQVINIKTGQCVTWCRFDGDLAELYDVAILRGSYAPMAIAARTQEANHLVTYKGKNPEPVVAQ